jgi:hypothetical protein
MGHHVTDASPTHHVSECAATSEIRLPDPPSGYGRLLRWFHMCGEAAVHEGPHVCGECGVRFL